MTPRERLRPFYRSPLVTWVDEVDPVRLVWANDAAIKLFQASDLDELCARSFDDIPEATRIQRRNWLEAFRDRRAEHFEQEWTLYPAGVPTRLMLYISPFDLGGGELGFMFQAVPMAKVTAPDIMRSAEVVRHTSAAVALVDQHGLILQRNPAAARAFGARSPFEAWFDDPKLVTQILGLEGADILQLDLRTTRSGQTRDYALEARRTRDPVGGEELILVHLLDETARRGAERESVERGRLLEEVNQALGMVEEQKQRWRTLVDSAPDRIMIVDRAHVIEFANRGFEGLGAHAPNIEGQRLEAVFERDEEAALATTIELVYETGEFRSYEARTTHEYGARTLLMRFGAIELGKQIEQLTVIATDVTEHRELEAQLRHSQKMEAVGTLAGGVAHDFNNLLTVIGAACDELELELELENYEATRPLLDDVSGAIERAANLTRRLLVFSRKALPKPKRVELNELITGVSSLLLRALGGGVRLEMELCEQPCWVHLDPGQLEQVIINLGINARDAMPEGGTLTVASSLPEDRDSRVILEVRDTGVGMSEELQARIFEPFFTTKEPGKGTGLGLSMVHSLVAQNGGRLELHSAPGQGTRFRLLLRRVD